MLARHAIIEHWIQDGATVAARDILDHLQGIHGELEIATSENKQRVRINLARAIAQVRDSMAHSLQLALA